MSEAPERIWLQWFGDSDPDDPGEVYIDDVTWQDERIFDHDVEYVRADKADALAEAVELAEKCIGYFELSHRARTALEIALAAYRGEA